MKREGFTLIELLLCVALLVGLFVGIMSIYVYCFDLQETSRNTTLALNEARTKIEEIRNTNFDNIVTTYNSKNYNLTAINGILRTEATYVTGSNGSSNNNLINIRVVVCWRQKGGRIIGEGKLSRRHKAAQPAQKGGRIIGKGKLDAGNFTLNDLDGDGKIESPLELSTAIGKKQ